MVLVFVDSCWWVKYTLDLHFFFVFVILVLIFLEFQVEYKSWSTHYIYIYIFFVLLAICFIFGLVTYDVNGSTCVLSVLKKEAILSSNL